MYITMYLRYQSISREISMDQSNKTKQQQLDELRKIMMVQQ